MTAASSTRTTPTGHLEATSDGADLVLVRTFRAPIEDVWASITESDRLGRWYGTWEGDGREGATVAFTWTAEEGQPVVDATIVRCEAPHALRVQMASEEGIWDLEATLAARDGLTELRFVHHRADLVGVHDVGPGWEFYLDRLEAARADAPPPDFDPIHAALGPVYAGMSAT
ncbi:SRPBCC family protein [Solicola sp. PLA-1-18]|uniref:SRPBCC family protein n=1 Tax=Solicola sp. PLA-1-18 TaxID=3380532 RepID=UPI003B7868D3